MLVQDEEDLNTLFKLIDDTSIADPIAELRKIRLSRQAVKEQQAREMTANTEYRLQRIERVPAFRPDGEPAGTVEKGVELLFIKFRDFDRWSKEHGVSADALQAVAESREKQLKDKKGRVWRAYPFLWVDRTPSQEDIDDRLKDARDDADFRRKQASKEANKKAVQASRQAEPAIWRYNS